MSHISNKDTNASPDEPCWRWGFSTTRFFSRTGLILSLVVVVTTLLLLTRSGLVTSSTLSSLLKYSSLFLFLFFARSSWVFVCTGNIKTSLEKGGGGGDNGDVTAAAAAGDDPAELDTLGGNASLVLGQTGKRRKPAGEDDSFNIRGTETGEESGRKNGGKVQGEVGKDDRDVAVRLTLG